MDNSLAEALELVLDVASGKVLVMERTELEKASRDAAVIIRRAETQACIEVIQRFAKPWVYHKGGMVGALRERLVDVGDVKGGG